MGLFDLFSSDIAIDLGTANTLIINKEKIVVDEPSIIAIDRTTNKVLAIGRQAIGRRGVADQSSRKRYDWTVAIEVECHEELHADTIGFP